MAASRQDGDKARGRGRPLVDPPMFLEWLSITPGGTYEQWLAGCRGTVKNMLIAWKREEAVHDAAVKEVADRRVALAKADANGRGDVMRAGWPEPTVPDSIFKFIDSMVPTLSDHGRDVVVRASVNATVAIGTPALRTESSPREFVTWRAVPVFEVSERQHAVSIILQRMVRAGLCADHRSARDVWLVAAELMLRVPDIAAVLSEVEGKRHTPGAVRSMIDRSRSARERLGHHVQTKYVTRDKAT